MLRMRPHHIIAITDKRKLRHGPDGYAIVWLWTPSGWSPHKPFRVTPYTEKTSHFAGITLWRL